QQSLRHLPVGADFDAPALRLVAERLEALCHVGWTVAVVHLEVEGVAQDEREDQAIAIDAGPAEHAPRADRAEATQLVLQEVEEVRARGHLSLLPRRVRALAPRRWCRRCGPARRQRRR